MRIALISCSKEKKNYACPAYELYSASNLFTLSYQYAKQNADKVYILSAKYGLVDEGQIIQPYNQTLKEMNRQQQLSWASSVVIELKKECNLVSDSFILLAGNTYCRDLIQHLPNHSLPLDGLRMGERMAKLKRLLDGTERAASTTNTLCERLHKLFNSMPRYTWEQISQIPFTNGIYIIFEKGDQYKGMERIVRVGTHTSADRLKTRLVDHFVRENHDGSIFRKNIGKAILNAHHDPYLATWTIDTSKPENRNLMDKEKNAEIERRVSKYLRENFTFTVFQVTDKDERLRMEEAIIAALNVEPTFRPCAKWPGLYSPETEIRESGLWLKRGLNGTPITENEFIRLLELCGQAPSVYDAVRPVVNVSGPKIERVVGQSCGKYSPLLQFLQRQTANQIIMTYDEVEAILGFQLPNSAYTYTMWWNPKGHAHCQAWLQAGFAVADASETIRTKIITFNRVG
jgi:hypothetical protein